MNGYQHNRNMPPSPNRVEMRELIQWQRYLEIMHGNALMDGSKPSAATAILAVIVEMGELANELNWKPWKEPFELHQEKVMDEWSDALAFFLTVTGIVEDQLHLRPDDLVKHYIEKTSDKILARIAGEHEGYGEADGVRRDDALKTLEAMRGSSGKLGDLPE